MEYLADYILFLLKAITVLGALLVLIFTVAGLGQKNRQTRPGHLVVRSLSEEIRQVHHTLELATLPEELRKGRGKEKKKAEKEARKKQRALEKNRKKSAEKTAQNDPEKNPPGEQKPEEKKRIFVMDFAGDLEASGVSRLRAEVSAIVEFASTDDEVLLRLQSRGGVVDGYGLAASQLKRFGDAGIRLVVSVDLVAASGGYMMACLGDKIIAAPFALLGSIGVASQVPNLHRLLKKHDIDVDIVTAGEYKRTLTLLGENTEKGRRKFQEEIDDVHILFKDFVKASRPALDIDEVATGEAWFGRRALAKNLVDELSTSDEYLLSMSREKDIFHVEYVESVNRFERLLDKLVRLRGSHGVLGPRVPLDPDGQRRPLV